MAGNADVASHLSEIFDVHLSSKSGYVYQSKKNIMYYITVISEKVVATASLFWIPKAFA